MSTANTRPRFTDVVDDAGTSYRQADHWCRKGWIRAGCIIGHTIGYGDVESCVHSGTGHSRYIDDDEIEVLQTMARLVHAGLTPEVAAHLARSRTRLTDAVVRGLERLRQKEGA